MANSLVKSLSEAEQYVNTTNLKLSCKVATNASGTLSSDFEAGDTIDSITLSVGDRILIKDLRVINKSLVEPVKIFNLEKNYSEGKKLSIINIF